MGPLSRSVVFSLSVVCLLAAVGTARSLDRKTGNASAGMVASAALPASTPRAPDPTRAERLPPGEHDAFFNEPDAPVREALSSGEIATIEKGRGGRSLGFRITLNNGQKGYFKPEQTFSAANWFGEVAAYHLDRLLGLGRVPVVVSRVFPWRALAPVAGSDPRTSEVTARDGKVIGAFVAWVTGGLKPMPTELGWERWLRIEHLSTTAVSPFKRPILWKRDLSLARRLGTEWRTAAERALLRKARPEPDRPDRPAELSDLLVFDYLTRNLDRWGGENGNVLVRGPAGPLVFLDNGAGFEPGAWQPDLGEARLHLLQRFRRRTVQAVRALDLKRFEQRLATEAVTPVLQRSQLNGLATRRTALLAWVAELELAHGEAIWAWE